jgi:hypothetical protein
MSSVVEATEGELLPLVKGGDSDENGEVGFFLEHFIADELAEKVMCVGLTT